MSKGCPKKHLSVRDRVFPQPKTFKHAVRCCHNNDIPNKCISSYSPGIFSEFNCFGKHTYDYALQICASKGSRLCQNTELNTYCCGTGCMYDNEWVWVSDTGKKVNFRNIIHRKR